MPTKFIDSKLAKKLLNDYGSPLYVYDEATLRKMAKKVSRFLDGYDIKYKCYYAVKANSNLHLLKILKEEGFYVDSMSPGELAIVQKAGFKANEILYVANNISENEMKAVADQNIMMVFDSISQIETYGKMSPNQDIMVRINPGIIGVGHSKQVVTAGNDTKFGISEDLFDQLKEVTKKYNLNIVGLHQHLGSFFLDDKIDDYVAGVKKLLELASAFENLKVIDLGGGFGIPYHPDMKELDFNLLNTKLVPLLKDFLKTYGEVKFIFEPGRIVIAEAGVILGQVLAFKTNMGTSYIGTDIGMGIIERPSRYDSYHHIEILNDNKKKITANIAGDICESCDVLGKARKVNEPAINDPIIVYDAGAYGFSMASNYTSRTRPAEILLTRDGEKLIRKEETIEDLLRLF